MKIYSRTNRHAFLRYKYLSQKKKKILQFEPMIRFVIDDEYEFVGMRVCVCICERHSIRLKYEMTIEKWNWWHLKCFVISARSGRRRIWQTEIYIWWNCLNSYGIEKYVRDCITVSRISFHLSLHIFHSLLYWIQPRLGTHTCMWCAIELFVLFHCCYPHFLFSIVYIYLLQHTVGLSQKTKKEKISIMQKLVSKSAFSTDEYGKLKIFWSIFCIRIILCKHRNVKIKY